MRLMTWRALSMSPWLKDKDVALKKLRRADMAAKASQEQIPGYQASSASLTHDKHNVDRAMKEQERVMGRGLHSCTVQLNLSALYGIGGARRDCVVRVKGVVGGV
jgi:hypothetical protein